MGSVITTLSFYKSKPVIGYIVLVAIIAVVFIGVISICGLVFYCIRRANRKSRRGYRTIPDSFNEQQSNGGGRGQPFTTSVNLNENPDQGVSATMTRRRMEQEQQRKEVALLSCQFYLRSMPEYILDHQLPEIGSRMSKNWFLVKQIRGSASTLLTMLPVSQQCRLNLTEEKETLMRLMKELNHMYIHEIFRIEYIPDRRLVVIMESFHDRGSLKDLLYQTTPNLNWSMKYSIRHSGLKQKQIKLFGNQVLHGVMFLHHLGLKPFGQIQSGNIYFSGGRIKVSGFENYLLGYKPRMYQLVREYRSKIDSAMFGHLIFELSSGRELSTALPTDGDITSISNKKIQELLNFIFHNETSELPSIEDISKHPFFCDQNEAGLSHWSYEGVRLDEGMKKLIVRSKIGRVVKRTSTSPGKKKRQKSNSSKYPVFQPPPTLTPIAQSPNTISTEETNIDSTPTTLDVLVEHNVPPPSSSPSANRSALLGDICSGTTLKKTVTNDRSAPMLH